MFLRIFLLALVCFSLTTGNASGAIQLVGHDPASNSFFDVFVDLHSNQPGEQVQPPNLTDSSHPTFTVNTGLSALFDFGMRGQNGEIFNFQLDPDSTGNPQTLGYLSNDGTHLVIHFHAVGNMSTFFDVFFDASYDDRGPHPPDQALLGVTPLDPVFPPGSFSIAYNLQLDPPFTVGIIAINPNNNPGLQPMTFAPVQSAVPEPGSFCILLGGLLSLAGHSLCRRCQRAMRGKGGNQIQDPTANDQQRQLR